MKYVHMEPKMKHFSSLHGSSRKRAFIVGFIDGFEAPLTLFRWDTILYLKTPNPFSEKRAWESATRYIREAQQNDVRQLRERSSQK
jgi:hypothetical protein